MIHSNIFLLPLPLISCILAKSKCQNFTAYTNQDADIKTYKPKENE